jgi:antitoxin component of MazEF toxin-antitoxin module
VRIPASVMSASGLKIDQSIEIRAEAGRVVIEPAPEPPTAIDGEFAAAVAGTLAEWASAADDEAWAGLCPRYSTGLMSWSCPFRLLIAMPHAGGRRWSFQTPGGTQPVAMCCAP